jgi:fluoroquinolone transport system permease protein
MSRAQQARLLLGVDSRSIGRDPLLRWILVAPLALALLVRFIVPLLNGWLRARAGLTLEPFYPLIFSWLPLMMPAIIGALIGFLLLDQRDDGSALAMRVTPVTPTSYLAYRLATPIVLNVLVTIAMLSIVGRTRTGPAEWALVAFVASPIAPTYALFLASFARNKVEGFALMKAVGIVSLPLVAAWWVDEPWQWLFGIVPFYWPAKLFWVLEAGERGAAVCVTAGLATQALLIWLLLRRFRRTQPS